MNCTNLSGNASAEDLCADQICVEDTIYRKVMGTLIFLLVWPFIVLDMKWFPLGRPAAAIAGATLMVIFSIVPPGQVFEVIGAKGSLQAVCLLLGMMLISYYYDREGLLQFVALWIFGKNKPFKTILWKVCAVTACMAAVITNDATSLIMSPLILGEHIKQRRSKKELGPLLIGIATCANIGSAATFFGNPQNAFIAANSNGKISLLIFFQTTLPAAIMGVLIALGLLHLVFFRVIFRQQQTEDQESGENERQQEDGTTNTQPPIPTVKVVESKLDRSDIAASREDLARGYDQSEDPNATSQVAIERDIMYQVHRSRSPSHLSVSKSKSQYSIQEDSKQQPTNVQSTEMELKKVESMENEQEEEEEEEISLKSILRRSWRRKVFIIWLFSITGFIVILLTIPPPPTVRADFNLGLVPLGAGVLTMVADTLLNRKYAFDAIFKLDWSIVLMFMGLFTWLQGFENTGLPGQLFGAIRNYMNLKNGGGVIFFAVFVFFGSNFLSNVPLTILVVDEIGRFVCTTSSDLCPVNCPIQLVGVLLAWVATISGTFTLLGSVTNLIVAEKARGIADYRLTFLQYFKFGGISALIVMFSGLPIVYFLGTVARS